MERRDEHTAVVFNERIRYLNKHGYRGFYIDEIKEEWDGMQATARHDNGLTVTASGETKEEAYRKLIDQIDQALDPM